MAKRTRFVIPEDNAEFWAGIDENGLGPVLGPLVVTGVLARVRDERARAMVQKKAPKKFRARIDDSKNLVSHDDDALGEAWARALVSSNAMANSSASTRAPRDVDALIDALMLDPRAALTKRCPPHHDDHCFGARAESFAAPPELTERIEKDLRALASLGVEIVAVKSVVVCNRALNDEAKKDVSRFSVDLHAMERLVLHFRDVAGARLNATCGKVGGFDFYDEAFGPMAAHLRMTLAESRRVSAYEFPGTARVSFVMDADASHFLVSLASLVGKWMRDVLMRKILAYYKDHDATLPSASGYHDPVTRKFISATALVRKKRNVEDACFLRSKLQPKPTAKKRDARKIRTDHSEDLRSPSSSE